VSRSWRRGRTTLGSSTSCARRACPMCVSRTLRGDRLVAAGNMGHNGIEVPPENAGEGAPREGPMNMVRSGTPQTRGVLFVHSAPSALCAHVEWAAAGVLGGKVDLAWTPQPAEPGTYRAELSWQAPVGTAATLASTLRGWDLLRFEITEEPTATSEGARYSFTPSLGIFHAMTGLHGDVLIPE